MKVYVKITKSAGLNYLQGGIFDEKNKEINL